MNQLEALQRYTIIVADTGEIDAIKQYEPRDATTNPSLILKAAQMEGYSGLVDEAIERGREEGGDAEGRVEAALDHLFVAFGTEILGIIPGRVSTEVSARLSFDTQATIAKAEHLIELYDKAGIDKERVLIKIASTWEGIRAAEALEQRGIHCNLTLLFGFGQAAACADAGVKLISPFVGRIYDWYKAERGVADIPVAEDPGVASVQRIYDYYRRHGYATEVMGASFRKADQVTALAGCDLLTISPNLLQELKERDGDVPRVLSPEKAKTAGEADKLPPGEERFRWELNEDAMATEKLAQGIRAFHADAVKLSKFVAERTGAAV